MCKEDLLNRAQEVDQLTRRGFGIGYRACGEGDVSAQFEWRLYQAELGSKEGLKEAVFQNYSRRIREVGELLERIDGGGELSEREWGVLEQFGRDAGTIE